MCYYDSRFEENWCEEPREEEMALIEAIKKMLSRTLSKKWSGCGKSKKRRPTPTKSAA